MSGPFGPEYPKISGPFKRWTDGERRNKLKWGDWSDPAFDALQNVPWHWTEKVDGTNVRVHWDGHKPAFGGRTDKAQMHPQLIAVLENLFPEELLEENFQGQTVTFYGEGYGAGIQKGGGNYSDKKSFILFDILINGFWLKPDDVEGIGEKLQLRVVPSDGYMTVHEAIGMIKHPLESVVAMAEGKIGHYMEGLVGVPLGGLLDRHGRRIMMKLKTKDLMEMEK